tara:strand:- start:48 stop:365 length:318 start_codon:yes stop_codon:yes gene_type:complete
MTKINYNGVSRDMTAEEQAQYDKDQLAWNSKSAERKLAEIKRIRLQKLQETDFYALGDVTMSDAMKTYRQNLRDIPANHMDEAAYDLLLTRDASGNLTHNVWSKP